MKSEAELSERQTLKRATASRSSGEWKDDDYDVLADGVSFEWCLCTSVYQRQDLHSKQSCVWIGVRHQRRRNPSGRSTAAGGAARGHARTRAASE